MKIFKAISSVAVLIGVLVLGVAAQNLADQIKPKAELPEISKVKMAEVRPDISKDPQLITASTYAFSASAGVPLEDMSTGTTQLVAANVDDTASAVTNIGFSFVYDGVAFTQFSVNANGLFRFGSTAISTSFNNTSDFASTTNAPKVAAYFDDLWVGTNGKVHYKVVGSAPNRKLVVEWQNMQIPRVASGNTGAGTFQVWIFETTGVIQFVYGNGIAVNSANGGYSIGLQSGAATNFASVTNATSAVSYTTANNAQTDAITAGTSYSFTPNIPAAPTGINFTAVAATTITVNWTDVATNELGYLISRSTDGVNFTQAGTTAANAGTFIDSSLTPSTTYTYRVQAFTEGALSTALTGSQATSAPGNITTVGSGGFWSNPATWSGGTVPTASDNVVIGSGASVTIDTAAFAYSVTVGPPPPIAEKGASDGVFGPEGSIVANLTFEDATARSLTVGGDVTVVSGAFFGSAVSGTVTTHTLNVGGNIINNGTLDFSTNGNLAGAGIVFTSGASNVTFGGAGLITDVRSITVNKGAQATIVELNPANFTVQGVNTDVAGYLTITSGTFKISGTFTITNRTFPTATYTIPLLGGIWLNNPNYTVAATASSTTTLNNGLFRISNGTYNIGVTGADGMGGSTGATFIVEGGTINATRIDPQSAVTFTMSGGTINAGTVANTRSNFGTFELFNSATAFNMSGGVINLIQAAVAATPIDYQVRGIANISGGVLNVGTAATTTNFNFRIRANTPQMVIDNTTNAKTATFTAQTLIFGNVLVNPGTTFNLNGFLVGILGRTFTNNGTVTGTTANSRFYWLGTPGQPQLYTGSGTVTAPLASWDVDSIAGVTIDPGSSQIVTLRVILFTGTLSNSNKITLGNGGTTSGTIQIGNTTTPTTAISFDQPFVFNLGTGGQFANYLRTTNSWVTGGEINPTRTFAGVTVDNNVSSLIVFGGDITVTGTLALTNGVVNMGPNTLTHNGTATRTNGYVNGRLNRSFTATGAYTYHVGQNGYTPVLATVTALGVTPSSLAAQSFDATLGGFDPSISASRNWQLDESGDLTADLSFTYLAGDAAGNEADYRVYRRDSAGATTNFCSGAPCVNTTTHVGGPVVGVTGFSRWTVAENQTTTAAPNGSVSGRVMTWKGLGIRNAAVTVSGGGLPQPIMVLTGSFGFYTVPNLPVGQTYTVTVAAKRFSFTPTSRTITVEDDAVNFDFVANP